MPADLTAKLSEAIRRSVRAAKFCCGGTLSVSDPQLEVANLGVLRFPLSQKSAKRLMEQCQVAAYGKGTRTLIDAKVRNTLELSPDAFQLGAAWNAAIEDLAQQVAVQLGLPAAELEPKLYKLLVYKSGGFFLSHRDSEKDDRMVASLIVVLPNPFSGGTLIVRHSPSLEESFRFEEAQNAQSASFAAFYADCEHEVKVVDTGVRVCLAYNLVLRRKRTNRGTVKKKEQDENQLLSSLRGWFAAQPSRPLVFALEHHYTERGLAVDLLKGTDRALADLLIPLAEQSDCHIHLAHVSRHLLQYADDGSFGARYGRSRHDRQPKRRRLEIGETYEDELLGTEWTSLSGARQPWGAISFDTAAIVSAIPIDDWKPTTESYEGYTGNAGNTLDRWYHRTAIVLWPQAQHFAVLATSGPAACIPLFLQMLSKQGRAARSLREARRAECIAFARAIIATWPDVSHWYRSVHSQTKEASVFEKFRDQLLKLGDCETIQLLLTKVAVFDPGIDLTELIVEACSAFGTAALAPALRTLLNRPPERPWRRKDIPLRDVEWLAALCDSAAGSGEYKPLMRELCRQVVERFCEPPESQRSDRGWGRDTSEPSPEHALPSLLKALAASGCEEELGRVIPFVNSHPEHFSLEHGLVPALRAFVPWARGRFGQCPQPVLDWLHAVRLQLEAATAVEPPPPADWRRPSRMSCGCEYCAQLGTFLQDPTSGTGRIAAREDIRRHLISEIERRQYDVTHQLEKLKSPYSLAFTKTQGSWERALRRYQLDQQLLESLPSPD